MPDSVQKIFPAVKAFVVKDGKVLLLKESVNYADGANDGKWDVPGGRIDIGERWDTALLREVKEETGLEVVPGNAFAMNEWRPVVRGEQWQVVATFIECTTSGAADSIILSQDHVEYKWFNPEEIVTLEGTASAIQEVAQQYLDSKKAQ